MKGEKMVKEQQMNPEAMKTAAKKSVNEASNFIILTYNAKENKVDRHAFVNHPTAALSFLQYMNTLSQGLLQPPQPATQVK